MAEAGHLGGGAADASANPSRARRVVQIVLAVLVAFVVPVLLLDALVGSTARTRWSSAFWSAPRLQIGGTRRMLYLAPAIGLAAGLGRSPPTAGGGWVSWLWGVVAGAGIGFG
jgi:hypothetical protein